MNRLKAKLLKMNHEELKKGDFYFLFAILLFFFLVDCYSDFIVTYTHGVGLIEGIVEGKITHIYDYMADYYAMCNGGASYPVAYSITLYLLFSLWNLPVWIIHKISGIGIYHPLFLFWGKLMLIFFTIMTLSEINKILTVFQVDRNKRNMTVFCFLSSTFFLATLIGCYDLLPLFFMMYALRVYFEQEEFNFKFLCIMSCAVSLKLFACLLFVPLLLLKEKRITVICRDVLAVVAPTMIMGILFHHTGEYAEFVNGMKRGMIDRLWAVDINGGTGNYPLFVVLFGLLCVFAYWKKCSIKKELCYMSLWLGGVAFIIFDTFVQIHPQWLLYGLPFIVMLIAVNKKQFKLQILLEMGMSVCIGLYFFLYYWWVYLNTEHMEHLLFGLLPISGKVRDAEYLLTKGSIQGGMKIIYGLALTCAIAFLVYHYPFKKATVWAQDMQEEYQMEKGLLYCRILVLVAYMAVQIGMFFL